MCFVELHVEDSEVGLVHALDTFIVSSVLKALDVV